MQRQDPGATGTGDGNDNSETDVVWAVEVGKPVKRRTLVGYFPLALRARVRLMTNYSTDYNAIHGGFTYLCGLAEQFTTERMENTEKTFQVSL